MTAQPPPRPRRQRIRVSRRFRAGARHTGQVVAEQTVRVVRPSTPPTDAIPVWTSPDGVDRATAQAVVDLALRVGVALLATGAPAREVVSRTLRVARAYGLRSIHVDVTFSSLTVSYHRGPNADPMTVMRVVRTRSQDFTRYQRLRDLVESLAAEPIDVERARVRLDSVIQAHHPYRRWIVSAATGGIGASAAALLGGGPLIVLLTFLTSVAIASLQHQLKRAGFAPFFTQAVGAAVPTAVAVGVAVLRRDLVLLSVSPSLVVAAGIVVLLSGLSFVGAAQDAIEGYYVTAGGRLTEVMVLTVGMIAGIVAVLAVAHRIGVPMTISTRTMGDVDTVVQVLAAAGVAASFAVSSYAVGRAVLVCGLAGGAALLLLVAFTSWGAGRPSASAAAALLVGLPAQLVARRVRIPALVITTAAILPLVPGRSVYQGVFQLVTNTETGLAEGLSTLFDAAAVGIGIAAGVSMGTSLGRMALTRRVRLGEPAPDASPGPADQVR
ncbi:MAG: threonine/serine exporter family protein [Actinomycetales bacterium]|nr:threonine/serine exporter family protein [Actinomycetales bacterium]